MKARPAEPWGVRPVILCAVCGQPIGRPQLRADGRFVCAECWEGDDGEGNSWTAVQRLVESGRRLPAAVT